MSSRLFRTFLSVPIPSEISRLQKTLKSTINETRSKISWVKDGNIHLTIKFIGDTPEDEVKK